MTCGQQLGASIQHASPVSAQQAISQYGARFVRDSKVEIAMHLTEQDIDDLGPIILNKASNTFLDQALQLRLMTIEATPLINALARAQRLGYDANDIIDGSERVTPANTTQANVPPANTVPTNIAQANITPANTAPANVAPFINVAPFKAEPAGSLQCPICHCTLATKSLLEYHVRKQSCLKKPGPGGWKHFCPRCCRGFSTAVGKQYHVTNKVCGVESDTSLETDATAPMPPATQPMQKPSVVPTVLHHASNTPPLTHGIETGAAPAASGTDRDEVDGDDRYAHLSNEMKMALDADLRAVEEKFAARFRDAAAVADPAEKKARMERLRNAFSTSKSVVRRRYGATLQRRRDNKELLEEKVRLGITNEGLSNANGTFTAVQVGASGKRRGRPPKRSLETASVYLLPGEHNPALTPAVHAYPENASFDDMQPPSKRHRAGEGWSAASPAALGHTVPSGTTESSARIPQRTHSLPAGSAASDDPVTPAGPSSYGSRAASSVEPTGPFLNGATRSGSGPSETDHQTQPGAGRLRDTPEEEESQPAGEATWISDHDSDSSDSD